MKEKGKIYSQQEVESAINKLKAREDSLKNSRKEINASIKAVRDDIKHYEELDFSQLRIC